MQRRRKLEKNEAGIENDEEIQEGLQHLKKTDSIFVDGGAILGGVVWNTTETYGEIFR